MAAPAIVQRSPEETEKIIHKFRMATKPRKDLLMQMMSKYTIAGDHESNCLRMLSTKFRDILHNDLLVDPTIITWAPYAFELHLIERRTTVQRGLTIPEYPLFRSDEDLEGYAKLNNISLVHAAIAFTACREYKPSGWHQGQMNRAHYTRTSSPGITFLEEGELVAFADKHNISSYEAGCLFMDPRSQDLAPKKEVNERSSSPPGGLVMQMNHAAWTEEEAEEAFQAHTLLRKLHKGKVAAQHMLFKSTTALVQFAVHTTKPLAEAAAAFMQA